MISLAYILIVFLPIVIQNYDLSFILLTGWSFVIDQVDCIAFTALHLKPFYCATCKRGLHEL